jgi:hypothetical protein
MENISASVLIIGPAGEEDRLLARLLGHRGIQAGCAGTLVQAMEGLKQMPVAVVVEWDCPPEWVRNVVESFRGRQAEGKVFAFVEDESEELTGVGADEVFLKSTGMVRLFQAVGKTAPDALAV